MTITQVTQFAKPVPDLNSFCFREPSEFASTPIAKSEEVKEDVMVEAASDMKMFTRESESEGTMSPTALTATENEGTEEKGDQLESVQSGVSSQIPLATVRISREPNYRRLPGGCLHKNSLL